MLGGTSVDLAAYGLGEALAVCFRLRKGRRRGQHRTGLKNQAGEKQGGGLRATRHQLPLADMTPAVKAGIVPYRREDDQARPELKTAAIRSIWLLTGLGVAPTSAFACMFSMASNFSTR